MLHIFKPYIYMFPKLSLNVRCRPHPLSQSISIHKKWKKNKKTPPRQFHRFAPNFAGTICGLSWHKVIKNNCDSRKKRPKYKTTISCTLWSNQTVLHILTKYGLITTALLLIVFHVPMRVCVKFIANQPIVGTFIHPSIFFHLCA